MPMGIVSDADFESELQDSATPEFRPEIIPMPRPGRQEGDVNVPDSLRKIIGETANIDGREEALALARTFGVSPSSVSAYTNGSTSTDSYDDRPNQPHIEDAKARVSKRAQKVLRNALSHITPEKLEGTKPVELAQIARSMSAIVKDMEPEDDGPSKGKTQPQFVVFSPTLHKEDHYEIKVVRE